MSPCVDFHREDELPRPSGHQPTGEEGVNFLWLGRNEACGKGETRVELSREGYMRWCGGVSLYSFYRETCISFLYRPFARTGGYDGREILAALRTVRRFGLSLEFRRPRGPTAAGRRRRPRPGLLLAGNLWDGRQVPRGRLGGCSVGRVGSVSAGQRQLARRRVDGHSGSGLVATGVPRDGRQLGRRVNG